jgi:hypothetical protein
MVAMLLTTTRHDNTDLFGCIRQAMEQCYINEIG